MACHKKTVTTIMTRLARAASLLQMDVQLIQRTQPTHHPSLPPWSLFCSIKQFEYIPDRATLGPPFS